jgi:protein farnesyltransferase/geranylgeranyltransferase type-1 subunit alpha
VADQKIPTPLPKPTPLGTDIRGVDLGGYTPKEYELWERREGDLAAFRDKSRRFRERRDLKVKQGEAVDIREIEDERNRRKLIGQFQGRRMGRYESDPEWDDVIPVPQDDGENALAAIAYTDEYAEGKPLFFRILDLEEYLTNIEEF